jgi:plasmid maintenance system antidote protein VapI
MTDLVICQATNSEIVTRSVIRQSVSMLAKHDTLLSEVSRTEMTPERIGRRMMLLREAVGLKPSEMADMLGLQRTYWSRFEGGKRSISETVAVALVERFGVTLDFLILGRWDKLPLDIAEKMRDVERAKNI